MQSFTFYIRYHFLWEIGKNRFHHLLSLSFILSQSLSVSTELDTLCYGSSGP